MSTETLTPPPVVEAATPDHPVVLLPDSRFFIRSVPVAGPEAADVASQVELALESLAPFPLAQLYHGHVWKPGAPHALVFASYRRRFTSDETETWAHADLVVPTCAAVFGHPAQPATTVLVPGEGNLTAVHWADDSGVPSRVVSTVVPAESSESERAALQDELLRSLGGSREVIELTVPPVQTGGNEDAGYEFASGDRRFTFRPHVAELVDVRDKEELADRRRARARDLLLWRVFAGLLLVAVLAGVAELALVGLGAWRNAEAGRIAAQRPVVEKIMTAQSLTTRIDELVSKRLRPIEMISLVAGAMPSGTFFDQTATIGLNGLEVRGRSSSANNLVTYENALKENPAVASVAIETRTVEGVSNFTLQITFKPDAFKSAGGPRE